MTLVLNNVKMKKCGFSWLVVVVAFLLTNLKHRVVVGQETTDYWTPILASLPSAVMGAINLALVARLSTQTSRNSLSSKLGLDKLFPGANGDGSKMLFVGKHNIQVSNHKDKKNVVEGGDYAEDCQDCEEYAEDYYEDPNGDYEENTEEEGGYDNEIKGKYKKKKKYNNYKYKQVKEEEKEVEGGDDGEEEEESKYKKVTEVRHVLVYPPKYGYNKEHVMTVPYTADNNGLGDMDYKTMMIKNAMATQYPQLDQNQVYWPDSQESKENGVYDNGLRHQSISTEKSPVMESSNEQATFSTPYLETGWKPILEQTTDRRPMEQTTDRRPVEQTTDRRPMEQTTDRRPMEQTTDRRPMEQTTDRRPMEQTTDRRPMEQIIDRRPFEQAKSERPLEQTTISSSIENIDYSTPPYDKELRFGDRLKPNKILNSDTIKTNDDGDDHNDYVYSEYQRSRIKRSVNNMNRVGNVPPLRFNRTSQAHLLETSLTPEVLRFLLTSVSPKPQNLKSHKSLVNQMGGNQSNEPMDPIIAMGSRVRKRTKKFKRKRQRNESKDIESYKKSSSNRVVKKTKMVVHAATRHPVRYVPLHQYKKILNFAANKKSDNNNMEEEVNPNNGDYYEDDYCGEDCEEEEDEEEEPETGKSHTTVQVIEKPEKKFNYGLSGWMRRMFSVKKGFFRRGDASSPDN